jgi:hypothetical protein
MRLALLQPLSFGDLPTQQFLNHPLIFWQTILSITSKRSNMFVNENNSMPYMKSLAMCLKRMAEEGYTEDFKVTDHGIQTLSKHCSYTPEQVQVVNFFRFEGMSDPDDNAVLYIIETDDGTRGTLIDAFGIYNDQRIGAFMKEVESFHKKV